MSRYEKGRRRRRQVDVEALKTIIIILFSVALVAYFYYDDGVKEKKCESKGGVWHTNRSGGLCTKPDGVIPLN